MWTNSFQSSPSRLISSRRNITIPSITSAIPQLTKLRSFYFLRRRRRKKNLLLFSLDRENRRLRTTCRLCLRRLRGMKIITRLWWLAHRVLSLSITISLCRAQRPKSCLVRHIRCSQKPTQHWLPAARLHSRPVCLVCPRWCATKRRCLSLPALSVAIC